MDIDTRNGLLDYTRARELRRMREIGKAFALKHNLPATAEVVRDKKDWAKNSCYGDIFDAAINELGNGSEKRGFEKLVALLKESRNVEWMHQLWIRIHTARIQHFELRFRCKLWTRLAWAMLRLSAIESLVEVGLSRKQLAQWLLKDLDNPFSPCNLFDAGELSPKLRNALRTAAA